MFGAGLKLPNSRLSTKPFITAGQTAISLKWKDSFPPSHVQSVKDIKSCTALEKIRYTVRGSKHTFYKLWSPFWISSKTHDYCFWVTHGFSPFPVFSFSCLFVWLFGFMFGYVLFFIFCLVADSYLLFNGRGGNGMWKFWSTLYYTLLWNLCLLKWLLKEKTTTSLRTTWTGRTVLGYAVMVQLQWLAGITTSCSWLCTSS